MTDIQKAMLGDKEAQERLTEVGVLLPCPWCNEDFVWVGVHDEEGNCHGPLGCNYEYYPWSGLSYALHHDGWGDCILCSDGFNGVMGGVLFDTAEEAIKHWNTRTPLLTPEQLEALERMEDGGSDEAAGYRSEGGPVMTKEEKRKLLIDLIVEAKKTDPETGSFTEWLADFLLGYGISFSPILPTADIQEVRHGRWQDASDGDGIVCSECMTDFCTMIHEVEKFNYCPNCGARMGKEDEPEAD